MAKQAERRAATSEAILAAARRLFGTQGFAATTMDEIAEGASVAKGAVYHHFRTKEAVFEAVFDLVSRDLVAEIDSTARVEKDVLAAMVAGTQHYFAATAKGPTGQIILRDGPAVLGWERWREIDAKHFGSRSSHWRGCCSVRSRRLRSPAPGARISQGRARNMPVRSSRWSRRCVCAHDRGK